ncbi:MAG: nicotinate (nicotinamide) nucleotide adenylyltransferase [Flavobacteriales bacterium]
MKRVGLYFGSFNPIHNGHLIVAEYFATQTELDEVWFVVSPHNPLKDEKTLAAGTHRLTMVKLAAAANEKLHVCDIEFSMPVPSYTYDTLQALRVSFQNFTFTLLLGEDCMHDFSSWKNFESILEQYHVMFFPRHYALPPDKAIDWSLYNTAIADAPRIEISSTRIRELITKQSSVRYLLPDEVIAYILKHKLY